MQSRGMAMLVVLFTTSVLVFVTHGEQMEVCPQLGCDSANKFSLMRFNLPRQISSIEWQTEKRAPLPAEQRSVGCVGNTDILICPAYNSPRDDYTSAMFLQTWTGEIIDLGNVDLLNKTFGANLRNDTKVFFSNGEKAQIVDYRSRSAVVMKHPTKQLNGTLSPILLEDLSYHVVVGNGSSDIFLYAVDSGNGSMSLLAHFNVTSPHATCPWKYVTQPAVRGNRVYLYGFITGSGSYEGDQDEALIAVDFTAEAPYYKVVWIYDMNPGTPLNTSKTCNSTLSMDFGGPPLDIQLQLMATEDRHIMRTSLAGIMIAYDNETEGSYIMGSPWGGHFMSQMPGSNYVWMNGFRESNGFRKMLVGIDTKNLSNSDAYKMIELVKVLSVDDVNVTSRLLSLVTSHSTRLSEALVVGVRVYAADHTSQFFSEICPSCLTSPSSDDTYGLLVALRPLDSTVIWSYRLSDDHVIEGQIIALNDKFILPLTNLKDRSSLIMAVR